MKKFTYLALAACSMLAIASCKKAVIDMNAQNGNNNSANNVGHNGNSSIGGVAASSNYNWTGTAPVSVKVDGVLFTADLAHTGIQESLTGPAGKFYTIVFSNEENENIRKLSIQISSDAKAGSYYNMPTGFPPAAISYSDIALSHYWSGVSGQYKIVTNDATTIEGYFYADVGDPTNFGVVAGRLTEGYFKVAKQ